MNCNRCGAKGADASGRCWDCVNRDFRVVEMQMNDKRSIWKIRDIEQGEQNESSFSNFDSTISNSRI